MSRRRRPDTIEALGIEWFMTELRVVDWARITAWYGNTLGLWPEVIDADGKFALLAAGRARLAIKQADSPEESSSGVRLHFWVRDLAVAHAHLVNLRIEVTDPADHPREPYREIRLHDPAGNPITLFAWRDGS
jgi:catechol-2,3-dioxygenase